MNKSLTIAAFAVAAVAFGSNAKAEMNYNPYVAISYNYSDGNAENYNPYYNSGTVSIGSSYNQYFGTELFYQHSNNYTKRYNGEKTQTWMQAYGLDLYGYIPLFCEQKFALVGTAGVAAYDIGKKSITEDFGKDKFNDSGIGFRFGGGMQYSLDENWDIRAIARYVKLNKVDSYDHLMEYTAGVKYNF